MVNKVILIGYVGQEPDFKQLDGGAKVASFSLATNETYKSKEGKKVEHTDWHNIVVWNRLAEIVEQYVSKGDKLFIEGKIRTRSYENQQGEKRYITEIFASSLKMLGGKPGESSGSSRMDSYAQQPEANSDFQPQEGDLPF